MITTKVRAIGNSLGVTLPREVLTDLGAKKGSALVVSKEAGAIVLRPQDEDFDRIMHEIHEAHAEAFAFLADR